MGLESPARMFIVTYRDEHQFDLVDVRLYKAVMNRLGCQDSQALVARLISRITISRATSSTIGQRGQSYRSFTAQSTTMVYTYSAPFETGKLKVSNIHSLQLVQQHALTSLSPLTRRTATKSPGKKAELQVRSATTSASPRVRLLQ
jgi:hypothetical protein